MTDKPKNKNRKKSLIISSIVKVLLIIVLIVACNSFDFIKFETWEFTSGIRNNKIIITYPDEEVTCKLITRNGYFIHQNEHVKEIKSTPNEIKSWNTDYSFSNDYITLLTIKDEKVVWFAIVEVGRELKQNKKYKGDYFPVILKQGYLIIPREESEVRNLIDQYIEQKEMTRISTWDRNLKE